MDTCTITALDVITAFAVPNPNGSSQSPSVFSGLVALQVAPLSRLPSLLRSDKILFKPILSAVDRVNLNSCFIVVNAAFQCKVESLRVPPEGMQSLELSMLSENRIGLFLLFHRIFHNPHGDRNDHEIRVPFVRSPKRAHFGVIRPAMHVTLRRRSTAYASAFCSKTILEVLRLRLQYLPTARRSAPAFSSSFPSLWAPLYAYLPSMRTRPDPRWCRSDRPKTCPSRDLCW